MKTRQEKLECYKCGKDVPDRFRVENILNESSKFGFILLCPDCSNERRK